MNDSFLCTKFVVKFIASCRQFGKKNQETEEICQSVVKKRKR